MLTDEQKRDLGAPLSTAHVKSRDQAGRKVSYIEAWHAIAEANRIFGFDGWTSETVDLRCVAERPRTIGKAGKEGFGVSYIARVRITVFAGDAMVTREGVGAGHGIDADLGQAHESAIKEAESDSRKRALMTFGNPFGLALYDKDRENVAAPEAIEAAAQERAAEEAAHVARMDYVQACLAIIDEQPTITRLREWWEGQKDVRRELGLKPDQVELLKARVAQRKTDLMPEDPKPRFVDKGGNELHPVGAG